MCSTSLYQPQKTRAQRCFKIVRVTLLLPPPKKRIHFQWCLLRSARNLKRQEHGEIPRFSHNSLRSRDALRLFALLCILDPLVAVDFHHVVAQRCDRSLDDLLHHRQVVIGLLQCCGRDPDLAVSGDVFTRLVQNLAATNKQYMTVDQILWLKQIQIFFPKSNNQIQIWALP